VAMVPVGINEFGAFVPPGKPVYSISPAGVPGQRRPAASPTLTPEADR
jgi:hypothetical protein